jgi:polyphosphate kinase
VVYGVVGLKTHTKLALVARQEDDAVRCYVHIGTGNYNAQTATLYTDLGLFTYDAAITNEALSLFNYLTGRALRVQFSNLLVAPMNMRETFLELIDTEVANHRAGAPAHIVAKMNALGDRCIMAALLRAAEAGVPIDLLVRGFCCLRPPRHGRIRIVSTIGRFLEHSRIFHFRNGAEHARDGRFYIGSADWLFRSLNHRVEVIAPVFDADCRRRLWTILQCMLEDQRNAWELGHNGNYQQRRFAGDNERGAQEVLMQEAAQQAYQLDAKDDERLWQVRLP